MITTVSTCTGICSTVATRHKQECCDNKSKVDAIVDRVYKIIGNEVFAQYMYIVLATVALSITLSKGKNAFIHMSQLRYLQNIFCKSHSSDLCIFKVKS